MRGVKIIVTGGTFDKQYDSIEGKLSFKNSHLEKILDEVRLRIPISVDILTLIDSLDMDDNYRKDIAKLCKNSTEEKIVIIHGTDTMENTARYLSQFSFENKAIVLTGAMVPYSLQNSDASFNLGSAILASHLLPPNIYIVMNGRYFTWDNVTKNKNKGWFEETKIDI